MYAHVLMPIAPDQSDTTAKAVKAAKFLAGAGGKVTAITVMEPIPAIVMAEIPVAITEENIESARTALERAVGPGVEAHVVSGHAARTILEYAENNNVDCIVVASHTPGLEDFLIGSTAAKVVRHAQCAVHVVR